MIAGWILDEPAHRCTKIQLQIIHL